METFVILENMGWFLVGLLATFGLLEYLSSKLTIGKREKKKTTSALYSKGESSGIWGRTV